MNRAGFVQFIAERRALPFAWGAQDCCLTAADALIAAGHPDFAHDLRGYTTKKGAVRALLRAGFLTVGHVLNARLQRVGRARLGTVVMMREPPLDVLFIAEGASQCWGQGEHGLVRVRIPANASLWEPK
ncbi:MAG: hypothetical protein NW206_19845 [Hyphomonadaceae bacterium]|nr:hypothetical protein [Hyphomonadaceae bacterium]